MTRETITGITDIYRGLTYNVGGARVTLQSPRQGIRIDLFAYDGATSSEITGQTSLDENAEDIEQKFGTAVARFAVSFFVQLYENRNEFYDAETRPTIPFPADVFLLQRAYPQNWVDYFEDKNGYALAKAREAAAAQKRWGRDNGTPGVPLCCVDDGSYVHYEGDVQPVMALPAMFAPPGQTMVYDGSFRVVRVDSLRGLSLVADDPTVHQAEEMYRDLMANYGLPMAYADERALKGPVRERGRKARELFERAAQKQAEEAAFRIIEQRVVAAFASINIDLRVRPASIEELAEREEAWRALSAGIHGSQYVKVQPAFQSFFDLGREIGEGPPWTSTRLKITNRLKSALDAHKTLWSYEIGIAPKAVYTAPRTRQGNVRRVRGTFAREVEFEGRGIEADEAKGVILFSYQTPVAVYQQNANGDVHIYVSEKMDEHGWQSHRINSPTTRKHVSAFIDRVEDVIGVARYHYSGEPIWPAELVPQELIDALVQEYRIWLPRLPEGKGRWG